MTNFDILRSGFCTTNTAQGYPFIKIQFKTAADMHAGFDALMALMTAELKRAGFASSTFTNCSIDTNIDKNEGIGGAIVNAVHDFGVEGAP